MKCKQTKSLLENIQINLNEADNSKNSEEILKWSNQFVDDLLNDPEIVELSKLPNNEYEEPAVSAEVGKSYNGNTAIYFGSYGNGGEITIAGFNDDGEPYFDYDGIISYKDMLNDIKNEIKDIIQSTQNYNKEREEKLAKAKEDFSKLSQEEKDKIVMDYLINNIKL